MMNKTELDSKVWKEIKETDPTRYEQIQKEMKDQFEHRIDALHLRQFAPIEEEDYDPENSGSDIQYSDEEEIKEQAEETEETSNAHEFPEETNNEDDDQSNSE